VKKNLDRRRRILAMKDRGWGARRIARALGISVSTASEYLVHSSRPDFLNSRRRPRTTVRGIVETRLAEILREPKYRGGDWSIRDMADRLGAEGIITSDSRVSSILHRLGYRTRWVHLNTNAATGNSITKESA
jgi:transposase